MPIFDAGSPAYQSASVGQSAALIWSGTASALAGITPAVTLRDITIINTGTATVFIGGSLVTATAFPLGPGQQMTVQGWTATSNKTTNDIFGICSAGTTVVTTAGLATLASVV